MFWIVTDLFQDYTRFFVFLHFFERAKLRLWANIILRIRSAHVAFQHLCKQFLLQGQGHTTQRSQRQYCNTGRTIISLCLCTSGIPADVIEKGRDYKLVTEVVQNGNEFSWTQHYPAGHSVTNRFVIGKECDMATIGGKKFKVRLRRSLFNR